MKERITTVHSNYSELDERDIQLYSKKGRKPADADCYSGGDLSLFGDDVCCYIRYVRGQIKKVEDMNENFRNFQTKLRNCKMVQIDKPGLLLFPLKTTLWKAE